jgi:formate dehydrogenase (coenzyme F420) beta subunit
MEETMAETVSIHVDNQDLLGALRGFFASILKLEDISAVLVPWQLPMKNTVMPTLVTDPALLVRADPLSPAFPMNAAKVVSRLTRRPSGGKVAAVMRPCEIRAFTELVKLKQGRCDDLVTIGIDCLGALDNRAFARWVGEDMDASTRAFCARVLTGDAGDATAIEPATACRACEFPTAPGADIAVALYGIDTATQVLVQGQTEAGQALLARLDHPAAETPPQRQEAVDRLVDQRTAVRDEMFAHTRAATGNLEKLTGYLADCVNCYNCRVACPVCYCRECVFSTDVFDHDPAQYLRWAGRKGAVKMPTDTVFYHLTRLAHMSTACVGCGQCSNACPNDIPVMELFRTVAHVTQAGFDYSPGRSLTEPPPLAEFRENEFPEVVGIHARHAEEG